MTVPNNLVILYTVFLWSLLYSFSNYGGIYQVFDLMDYLSDVETLGFPQQFPEPRYAMVISCDQLIANCVPVIPLLRIFYSNGYVTISDEGLNQIETSESALGDSSEGSL